MLSHVLLLIPLAEIHIKMESSQCLHCPMQVSQLLALLAKYKYLQQNQAIFFTFQGIKYSYVLLFNMYYPI